MPHKNTVLFPQQVSTCLNKFSDFILLLPIIAYALIGEGKMGAKP